MRKFWKGMLSGALAVAIAGASSSAWAVCGDLNGNGGIDGGDAVTLSQYLGAANMVCDGPNPDCDLDGNASIGVGDLLFILNVLAGVETLTAPCAGLGPVLPCGSTISGNITSNVQLAGSPAPCTHTLDGTVIVQPNVTLTINAGATVEALRTSSDLSPSALIVVRDAKINLPGTAVDPIILTSDAASGSKGVGDWGGVVLNGRAPINAPGGVASSEGLPPGQALFGGNEPNDSSGLIRFTRIEFSGVEFSIDNELNVFTQNAVGRGTTIDHVQANVGFDDCMEWFGGTVQEKFLVSSGCRDDLFDWQFGFRGAVQFGLAIQNPAISTGSGRHGFEADNNENGFSFLPRSNPDFCNMTMIGSVGQGDATAGRSGANVRRGTAGTISNSIIMDWSQACLRLDNDETAAQACVAGPALKTTGDVLTVQDSVCYNNGTSGMDQVEGSATTPCTPDQWYGLLGATEGLLPATPGLTGPDPGISTATYPTTVDDRWFADDIAPFNSAPDCALVNPDFFDSASYIGAFDPSNNPAGNWLSTPWISFDVN